MRDLAYIDKHPQPSPDDPRMPAVLKTLIGNLTATSIAQNVPRATESGDVHTAVYDYGNAEVLFALGSTSANGTFVGPGARKAYAAPYVRFQTASLWGEKRPHVL